MEAKDKWVKEFSLVNWSNSIYLAEASFYEGNVTQLKWVAASEEYSVIQTRTNFKCNVFALILITRFLLLNCLKVFQQS